MLKDKFIFVGLLQMICSLQIIIFHFHSRRFGKQPLLERLLLSGTMLLLVYWSKLFFSRYFGIWCICFSCLGVYGFFGGIYTDAIHTLSQFLSYFRTVQVFSLITRSICKGSIFPGLRRAMGNQLSKHSKLALFYLLINLIL